MTDACGACAGVCTAGCSCSCSCSCGSGRLFLCFDRDTLRFGLRLTLRHAGFGQILCGRLVSILFDGLRHHSIIRLCIMLRRRLRLVSLRTGILHRIRRCALVLMRDHVALGQAEQEVYVERVGDYALSVGVFVICRFAPFLGRFDDCFCDGYFGMLLGLDRLPGRLFGSFLDRFDRCHYYFVGRTIVLGHGCRLGCWCNVAGRRRRQRFVYRAEVFEGYIPLYCVHTPLGPSVDDRCKAHEFLLNILQCHCRMYKFTPKIVNYLLIFKDTGANIGRRRRCGIWA